MTNFEIFVFEVDYSAIYSNLIFKQSSESPIRNLSDQNNISLSTEISYQTELLLKNALKVTILLSNNRIV